MVFAANVGNQEQPGLPLAWLKMYEVQAPRPTKTPSALAVTRADWFGGLFYI